MPRKNELINPKKHQNPSSSFYKPQQQAIIMMQTIAAILLIAPITLIKASAMEYDYYEYLYHPGYCRTYSNEAGRSGTDYKLYEKTDYDYCKSSCSASPKCMAFEFNDHSEQGRCEIWYTLPTGDYEPDNDTSCYHKRTYYAPKDKICKEVHRRAIYEPGQDPFSVDSEDGWKVLASPYSPFGYEASDPKEDAERWWRFYATYWDEYPGYGSTNYLEVKFGFPGDKSTTFTFPPVHGHSHGDKEESGKSASAETYSSHSDEAESHWRAEAYSSWYKFGSGSAYETDKRHSKAYAQLKSTSESETASYGYVYSAYLVAYDCYDSEP